MTPHEVSPPITTERSKPFGDEPLRAALLCASISFFLVLAFTSVNLTANPASRIATMDALVHDHSYIIDRSAFNTIDRVQIDGRNYSSKPPVYSTIGAVVYWVLHHTMHLSLRDGASRDMTLYVLTVLIAGIPHLMLLGYTYALLKWFTPSYSARIWTFASVAVGQLGLAYSTTVNNHVPAAAAVLITFYYAFGLRHRHLDRRKWRYWVLAGIAGGIAPTFDLGASFLSASIGLYLLTADPKRTVLLLAPAALLPIAVHFCLTWHALGSPLPAYLQHNLYDYEGSWWRAPQGLDALDEPRAVYLYNILLGHHGLFSMTPVLLFAVIAMVSVLMRRDKSYLAEALTIGVPLLILIVFYTLTTKNYGGACVGFRWFLPAIPVTLLFVSVWLSKLRSRMAFGVFLACLMVGQYHTYSALRDPWRPSDWDRFLTSQ